VEGKKLVSLHRNTGNLARGQIVVALGSPSCHSQFLVPHSLKLLLLKKRFHVSACLRWWM